MERLLESGEVHDAEPVDGYETVSREELDELRNDVEELRRGWQQVLAWMSGVRAAVNGVTTATAVPDTNGIPQPPNEAAWRAWKERLPEPCGRIIDALLVQPLSQTQLARMAKIHTGNVSKYMAVLRGNSLLEKDGDRWRLKRL